MYDVFWQEQASALATVRTWQSEFTGQRRLCFLLSVVNIVAVHFERPLYSSRLR